MTEQETDCGATMGPAPEHARLKEAVGTWKVDCTFYMDPSQPPMKNEATETVEMLGELWTTSRFTCDFMGQPFEGRATLGYEPTTGKWVSSWVDVMSPYLFKFEGGFDESGKILEMTGPGPNPMTGEMTTWRTREEQIDPDTRNFEMFITMPDGNEARSMSYVYTRQR